MQWHTWGMCSGFVGVTAMFSPCLWIVNLGWVLRDITSIFAVAYSWLCTTWHRSREELFAPLEMMVFRTSLLVDL